MSVPNVNCKIKYIQNEEDLAKSSVLTEKYGGNRQFYSSRLADDYMKYMDKGSKEKTDYISYAGDEEKSCGVFDKNGLLTSRGKQKLRQDLRKTKSIIWDCLLTFQPEFGQRYCNDYEVFWPQYMKSDTYLDDMYRRLGNQVLNYVRIYRRRERPAKRRLARKRIRRKTAVSVLAKGMEMQAALQVDSMYFFEEYLKKLEEAREDAANQEETEKDEME